VWQCFQELCTAAARRNPKKSIQTVAETDPHFEFVKAGIPEPQETVAFGQDSKQTVLEKRRRWEKQQKKVDWKRFKRLFHP